MNTKSDVLVSSLVMACSAVLVSALVFAISGNPWQKPRLRFTVDFTDITGIRQNSAVYYSGDKVGIVDQIDHLAPGARIEPDLPVRLRISILKDVPVSAHVKVTIAAVSPLGDKHVALTRVDDDGGLLADGARLTSRSTGGLMEMLAPGGDQIIAQIKDITGGLRNFIGPLDKDDAGRKLVGSLENIVKVADDLKEVIEGDGKTPGMTAKLREMADKLDHAATGIQDLVNGPGQDADKGLSKRTGAILANLEGFSNELNHTLAGGDGKPGLRERLATITDDIHGILAGPKGDSSSGLQKRLDKVTAKLDTLVEEMNTLAVWGEYVTGTLAGKPSRLIFGSKPNDVPTKEQILEHLRRTKQPYPVLIKEEETRHKGAADAAAPQRRDRP